MDGGIFLLGLLLISLLAGVGAFFFWRRGYRKLVLSVLGLIAALILLFWYLAATATGGHLPGLGEAIFALALLFGPGVGIVLGIATSASRWLGLGLGALYLLGLASLLMVP